MFNLWFYVWVGAVILLIYFFPWSSIGNIQLPSLPDFGSVRAQSSAYVPKRQISNTIIGLTYANMTIGQNRHDNTQSASYANDFEAMVGIRKELLELLERDFAQLMDNSTDREATLEWFITKLEYQIIQSKEVQMTAVWKMQDRETNFTNCSAQKEKADSWYLNAIELWDASYLDSLVIEAQEASKCMSDFRIKINAYALPLKQLQSITQISESYVLTLNDNTNNIVNYYELLRWDILQELINTKQKLWL